MKKDRIYASPRTEIEAFQFDDKVADVFEDMIGRSVPGYRMMLEMIGVIARERVLPNTQCYDLGCSLGAATLSMRHHLPHADCNIVAVDNAAAMTRRCLANIQADKSSTPVEVRCEDILETPINNASMVVMNFTLMFIEPELRLQMLRKIYQGLNPQGVLILSEKMKEEEHTSQGLLTSLYHGFKRIRGYSDLEISQKRSALENVLVPESLEAHMERLKQSGFEQRSTWFKCFGFTSIIAVK